MPCVIRIFAIFITFLTQFNTVLLAPSNKLPPHARNKALAVCNDNIAPLGVQQALWQSVLEDVRLLAAKGIANYAPPKTLCDTQKEALSRLENWTSTNQSLCVNTLLDDQTMFQGALQSFHKCRENYLPYAFKAIPAPQSLIQETFSKILEVSINVPKDIRLQWSFWKSVLRKRQDQAAGKNTIYYPPPALIRLAEHAISLLQTRTALEVGAQCSRDARLRGFIDGVYTCYKFIPTSPQEVPHTIQTPSPSPSADQCVPSPTQAANLKRMHSPTVPFHEKARKAIYQSPEPTSIRQALQERAAHTPAPPSPKNMPCLDQLIPPQDIPIPTTVVSEESPNQYNQETIPTLDIVEKAARVISEKPEATTVQSPTEKFLIQDHPDIAKLLGITEALPNQDTQEVTYINL